MGLFSFFKKSDVLKCAWCSQELENPTNFKWVGQIKQYFCSDQCKKNFRKFDSKKSCSCSTCPNCSR